MMWTICSIKDAVRSCQLTALDSNGEECILGSLGQ